MKKILVASSYFYPKIGGLENYAYLLAKTLHESGEYEVCIVTGNHLGKKYTEEMIDGMKVYRLPITFRVSNTPINPFWYWQVRNIIRKEKPDLVHVHSPVPYMPDIAAVAAKKIPVVLTYHSGSLLKGKFPIDLIVGAYEKIFLTALFKRANAVVAVSQEFAKRVFPQYAGKTSFIPTGVDLSRFTATHEPIDTEIFTYVGRIEHSSSWKGIEQLLQATAIVVSHRPNAKLELVGGGDALEHYKTRAQELGISNSVSFLGPLLGSQIVEAYARTSAVVLASTSDSEAFSVALVEAMASGRPIIGTAIGGTPQVIEEGVNGLLVPPSNPEKLAEAIERVLGDKAFAAKLGQAGATRAQNFSWDIQAKKYADLFAGVLAHVK